MKRMQNWVVVGASFLVSLGVVLSVEAALPAQDSQGQLLPTLAPMLEQVLE